MKKTIYFVRHGETAYNRKMVHQFNAVPLSPLGEVQARAASEALKGKNIDAILASDTTRTRQTAEYIAQALDKKIIFEEKFREIRRPASVLDKSFFHPWSIWIFSMLYLHAANLKWHIEDEENFAEIRDRAHEAIELLEEYDGENIVVVTHRIFLGNMLADLKCKFACSMGTFIRLSFWLGMIPNASITVLTYDSENKEWEIVKRGDTAHLKNLKSS